MVMHPNSGALLLARRYLPTRAVMPGTIGDSRLAVPRRRLRKLRERLMPSQRTLIVLAREHSRYERRALVKKIIFIVVFMCSFAYSIYVLLYFIMLRSINRK